MIGKTLAHYRIVEKIGAGGMGEVYRARDMRLDRDVALKILPPSLAGDPERLARANYVMALSYAGRIDEAEALTDRLTAEPDSDMGTWQMGLLRAAWRGDRAEVLRLTEGPYRKVAAWDAEVPWLLASAHAAVGAADEALHWLDRAIERGMINYPFLSEHDRHLDNVRSDPRFEGVLGRAKREWERLEV